MKNSLFYLLVRSLEKKGGYKPMTTERMTALKNDAEMRYIAAMDAKGACNADKLDAHV